VAGPFDADTRRILPGQRRGVGRGHQQGPVADADDVALVDRVEELADPAVVEGGRLSLAGRVPRAADAGGGVDRHAVVPLQVVEEVAEGGVGIADHRLEEVGVG